MSGNDSPMDRAHGAPPSPGSGAPPEAPPQVRSVRLLGTLGAAGALAGLLIVVAYQLTLPAVEANRAARLARAVHEVLPGIERYETLYLLDGALRHELPEGHDGRGLDRVYEGFDAAGARVGFAIPAGEPGFQDVIGILFGFVPETRSTLGMTVLESRETPGLGDKIEAYAWRAQFDGARVPLIDVKPGTATQPDEIDMITGATISARTVVVAINKGVERWTPVLDAYLRSAGGGGS